MRMDVVCVRWWVGRWCVRRAGGCLIEGCLNKRFVFLSSGWVGLGFGFRYGIVWHELPMGLGLELVVYGNIWSARPRLQVSFTMQICCYKIEECSSLLCLNKLCRLRRWWWWVAHGMCLQLDVDVDVDSDADDAWLRHVPPVRKVERSGTTTQGGGGIEFEGFGFATWRRSPSCTICSLGAVSVSTPEPEPEPGQINKNRLPLNTQVAREV